MMKKQVVGEDIHRLYNVCVCSRGLLDFKAALYFVLLWLLALVQARKKIDEKFALMFFYEICKWH